MSGSADMRDKTGIKTENGIKLGEVRIIFENYFVRIWELNRAPAETFSFHIHYHPYIVVSLGGGKNEIDTIFEEERITNEPLGSTVFIMKCVRCI